jgi:hypothetical protein
MFYILTCGSTASRWLSRALSQHPEIVCFHGVRVIAADPRLDVSEPLARAFVRELTHLYLLSEGECVFGGIHGFGAAEIAPEIAAVEGAFVAMIRHPIARLNSLFHREVQNIGQFDLAREDIYRTFRQTKSILQADTDREVSSSPELEVYIDRFRDLCRSVFCEDEFILGSMPETDVFRYENITSDPEYFRACFERLAIGCRRAMSVSPARRGSIRLDCTEAYLGQVFAIERFNRKSSGPISSEEIFQNWPDIFRKIFVEQLHRVGGTAASDRYQRFGYMLPMAVTRASGGRPIAVADNAESKSNEQTNSESEALSASSVGLRRFDQVQANIRTVMRIHSALATRLNEVSDLNRVALLTLVRNGYESAERVRSLILQLDATLAAECDAFVTRIRELEATVEVLQASLTLRGVITGLLRKLHIAKRRNVAKR